MKTVVVCLLGLACLVCGVAAAADALPPVAAKKIDWARMNAADRKRHMQDVVLPEMKKLFVTVDGAKYADMTCETCHGAKPANRDFKMPNPALTKLPPPMDRDGFTAVHQKNPLMARFMGAQVKPAMAALLGMDAWSPSNTSGFGCYACHTQQGDAKSGKEPAALKDPEPANDAAGIKEAKLVESDAVGAGDAKATSAKSSKSAKSTATKKAAKKSAKKSAKKKAAKKRAKKG